MLKFFSYLEKQGCTGAGKKTAGKNCTKIVVSVKKYFLKKFKN